MIRVSNFFVLCSILFCSVASAQDKSYNLSGTWTGEVEIPGKEYQLVFVIDHPVSTGKITGTLLLPRDSKYKLTLSLVVIRDRNVTIRVDDVGGSFSGKLSSNGKRINGDWAQGGFEFPLRLDLADDPEAARSGNRPQHPTGKPKYLVEEVSFKNPTDGINLGGVLTRPENSFGPRPAVLLLSDSGPHDRDGTISGHKLFLVLADYLTRRGFAVLRFDDRGVKKSEGEHRFVSHGELTGDAAAAINFLRGRSEIDSHKIGIIGHGEGALIAPLVITRREDVRFLVMLGGPGKKGTESIYGRTHAIGTAAGAPQPFIQLSKDFTSALSQLVIGANPNPSRVQEIGRKFETNTRGLSEKDRLSLTNLGELIESLVASIESPWMINFLRHDPGPVLEKVTCPVLAISGGKDLEFPARLHLPEIEAHLKAGGNSQIQVREIKGLNHLFQETKTGLPDEYAMIEETISPRVLKGIADWMTNVVR